MREAAFDDSLEREWAIVINNIRQWPPIRHELTDEFKRSYIKMIKIVFPELFDAPEPDQ